MYEGIDKYGNLECYNWKIIKKIIKIKLWE